MKRIAYLLFSISFICLTSCEQDLDQKLIDFKSLSKELNGKYITGEFHEVISSDGDYLLAIKPEGSQTYTDIFKIQAENLYETLDIGTDPEAILLSEGLVVRSRENNTSYFIGVEGYDLQEVNKELNISKYLLGYGFANIYGSWQFKDFTSLENYNSDEIIILNSTELSDQEKDNLLNNLKLQTSCSSGGEGSSSCSQGSVGSYPSCSVTCISGYYACCNINSCKCVKAQGLESDV